MKMTSMKFLKLSGEYLSIESLKSVPIGGCEFYNNFELGTVIEITSTVLSSDLKALKIVGFQ